MLFTKDLNWRVFGAIGLLLASSTASFAASPARLSYFRAELGLTQSAATVPDSVAPQPDRRDHGADLGEHYGNHHEHGERGPPSFFCRRHPDLAQCQDVSPSRVSDFPSW